MKSTFFIIVCRLLVASMTLLSWQSAHAGMIATERVIAGTSGQAERAAVLGTLGRAEVASQMQSLGVDPQAARERVAAMSDQEVQALAGKLERLPAGADGDGWAIAAVLIIAAAIYYFYAWK